MDVQKFINLHLWEYSAHNGRLVFIYHLSDVNRHNYMNTMEAIQRSKTMKQGK